MGFPIIKYTNILYDKNLNIQYKNNLISDYWATDKKIEDKLTEIQLLDSENRKNLAIISPADSTYSLYLERPIESPFSDLSTFLVNQSDVNMAIDNFIKKKVPYIIIDKTLVTDQNNLIPYENKFTSTYGASNVYNYKYQKHIIDLANITYKDQRYKVCNQTEHFIKICLK
jgi:hypothetical protein